MKNAGWIEFVRQEAQHSPMMMMEKSGPEVLRLDVPVCTKLMVV